MSFLRKMIDAERTKQLARIQHLESIVFDLDAKVKTGKIVEFEYPHTPRVRPIVSSLGGQRLLQIVSTRHDDYIATIAEFSRWLGDTMQIATEQADDINPYWRNPWFPVLDGLALYCLLRANNPVRYVEVGSGNSTKFARRAIKDGGLRTKIVSIDPFPRAEIDALCDACYRSSLENFDFSAIGGLASDDILFIDSSHRVSQGSDVAIFFSELLGGLPPGILYGIHDILLPDSDYPETWTSRHYGEHYLLGTYLLGGANGDSTVLPVYYSTLRRDEMWTPFAPLFSGPLGRNPEHLFGYSYWLRRQL